jgi:hypothetical protein
MIRLKADVLGCALSAVDAEAFVEAQLQERLQGFKRCHAASEDGGIQLTYSGESAGSGMVSAHVHLVYGQVAPWLPN